MTLRNLKYMAAEEMYSTTDCRYSVHSRMRGDVWCGGHQSYRHMRSGQRRYCNSRPTAETV